MPLGSMPDAIRGRGAFRKERNKVFGLDRSLSRLRVTMI